MKKLRLVAVLVVVGLIANAFAQEQSPKLKVELTVDQWNEVIGIIDQSAAPHVTVNQYKTVLLTQLQAQLKALQPDSTQQKK